ncbi:hypothetical protein [Mucilaginibacter sp. L196]|uniref:hypothetical protein n=1 Tax=Mucilaginibacter sp. L196 TaxID=1641870 RepID=UPI00131CB200|nr:hypothetical protein [Mucilaginibacter sp. L196]
MKKIFLGICLCAGIAVASSCGSHKATNAADGNNALLDSSKKTQDSTNADTTRKTDTSKKM